MNSFLNPLELDTLANLRAVDLKKSSAELEAAKQFSYARTMKMPIASTVRLNWPYSLTHIETHSRTVSDYCFRSQD